MNHLATFLTSLKHGELQVFTAAGKSKIEIAMDDVSLTLYEFGVQNNSQWIPIGFALSWMFCCGAVWCSVWWCAVVCVCFFRAPCSPWLKGKSDYPDQLLLVWSPLFSRAPDLSKPCRASAASIPGRDLQRRGVSLRHAEGRRRAVVSLVSCF